MKFKEILFFDFTNESRTQMSGYSHEEVLNKKQTKVKKLSQQERYEWHTNYTTHSLLVIDSEDAKANSLVNI